jgi:hypothetical protein
MTDAVDSLGKHPRTKSELRGHWAGYWENLVDDLADGSLERIEGQPNLRNAFRKDTSLGQSERAIAEDHPNREILELLQNARDEAQYADEGRVFLAVTDDGLLIANNGRSFNFHNRDVEEAATGIGKTSKDTPDEIGKMGIGLKSILGKGESFEVWTKAPDANGDRQSLRVRFSKSYLLAAILNSIGYDHGVEGLADEFNTDAFPVELDLSRNPAGSSPAELNPNNRRALMELFLFAYPVPLSLSTRRTELAALADYLVHGNERVADPNETVAEFGGQFTTAVFVEFEDSHWRSIVKDLYDVQKITELSDTAVEESGVSTTDPDRVWKYADGTHSASLDPETLIHFETIDSLEAVRVSNNRIDAHITWNVNHEDGSLDGERLSHTRWTVRQITRDEAGREPTDHVFDGFQLPSAERQHETQVLVPRPRDAWPDYDTERLTTGQFHTLENYPLYLYYPISYRDPGLAFSLHGKFAVTPNRQDLKDGNRRSIDYNRRVVDESITLIGRVAERVATSRATGQRWRSLYPWILIPTDDHKGKWDQNADPSETTELLGYLRDGVVDVLQNTACVPLSDGTVAAPSALANAVTDTESSVDKPLLLDWERSGWDGVRAVYRLSQQLSVPSDVAMEMIERPLKGKTDEPVSVGVPAADNLWGLAQLQSASGDHLTNRIETLLGVNDDNRAELTTHLREQWIQLVSETLTEPALKDEAGTGVRCPAASADTLLHTTARFFKTTASSDINDLLRDEYAAMLDGVYLLPSQLRRSPDDDTNHSFVGTQKEQTRIVLQIENQEIRSAGNRRQPLSRTVLWNIPDDNTAVVAPPEDGQFTVYFLAELAEEDNDVASLLDEAGEPWGIRKYQNDRQEFFRSLVASFDRSENNGISETALWFIADRVTEFTADDLNTLPEGYIAHELVETILDNQEYDRLRTRFRLRHAEFAFEDEAAGDIRSARISECQFGPAWWPFLGRRAEPDADLNGTVGTPSSSIEDLVSHEDVNDELLSDTAVPSSASVAEGTTLPAPFDPVWKPIYDEMKVSDPVTAARRLASTLCLFGAGVTPSIRALCHHGPGLEESKTGVTGKSWNPRKWDLPPDDPYRTDVKTLQAALTENGPDVTPNPYLAFVTGLGNHPGKTATHRSSRCHKQPYTADLGYGARISAWVWCDDIKAFVAEPEFLLSWLESHEDTLRETVLETGWYCDGNGKHVQHAWSETIPTLFNWQLRNAACWESLFDEQFSGWLGEAWGDDDVRLRWAVKDDGTPEVTQLLPVVTATEEDNHGVSSGLLTSLGVEPISELTPIQAADRLQKLQAVLSRSSGSSLDTEQPVPMETDGVESAWMYVYTELLQPIMDSLADADGNAPNVLDTDLLTHLPFRYKEREWRAVPIRQLHGDSEFEFKYHSQRSLRQWEKQEARNSETLHLLKPPTRGGIKPLADALDITSLDVEKPILNAGNLEGLSADGLQPVKRELERRTEWILATLNRSNPDTIREARDDFQTAIDNLARADLDTTQTADFFDRRSRLYHTADETEDSVGIVLNENELDGATTDELVKATAAGIAFLFEMPGRYEEIQPALRPSLGHPDELKREWEQRGHDPDLVSAALGTQDLQELLRDITSLYELIERLGGRPPDNVEQIRSNLTDTDSTTIQWLRAQFRPSRTGAEPEIEPDATVAATVKLLSGAASQLPAPLRDSPSGSVVDIVLGEREASHDTWLAWCHDLNANDEDVSALIEWLAANPRFVDAEWLPSNQAYWCARLERVCVLRDEREDADLASVAALADALSASEAIEPIEWADNPVATANLSNLDVTADSRWFDIAPRYAFEERALAPLLDTIGSHTSGGTDGEVAIALRDFVINGTVPSPQVDSRTRQRKAFRDVQSQLDGSLDLGNPEFVGLGQTEVKTFGGNGSNGDNTTSSSRTYGERGERAEAAAVLHILQRLSQWLDRSDTELTELMTRLEDLETDQADAAYKWHTKNRWNGSLERYLDYEFSAADYRTLDRFRNGERDLWDDPLVQILNSTQEYGLGFDFIDPFGTISDSDRDTTPQIDVSPVEVKAAGATAESDTVSFRFSTNQLRQAQAFVSAGYEYAIRLFATPSLETKNWLRNTKLVDEIVLNEDNPPAAALGGTTSGASQRTTRFIPADAVAGGEMYIERRFTQ